MTDTHRTPAKRGFAAMDPQRQREIASKGGKCSGGNFANNRERAAEAGREGGRASRHRETAHA
ncbi:general stress protein [Sphingomonas arenae]|uniref:general stress protein n=1 Tax=Sphingomonas arenae TaxID=2812555 RepID=UPI001968786E|nr:general stress protein [Sphingomonas arenae]